MKYFLDTEFLEGTQKKWFGQTKLTIDLQDNRFRYTYLVVDVVNGGGNSDMNIMLNKPKQKGVSVIKEDVKSKINIDVKNLYETIIDSKSDTW